MTSCIASPPVPPLLVAALPQPRYHCNTTHSPFRPSFMFTLRFCLAVRLPYHVATSPLITLPLFVSPFPALPPRRWPLPSNFHRALLRSFLSFSHAPLLNNPTPTRSLRKMDPAPLQSNPLLPLRFLSPFSSRSLSLLPYNGPIAS